VKADSVKVVTEFVYKDNTKKILDTRTIPSIFAESRYSFSLDYLVSRGEPNRTLQVTVDPDNKISEYYKDNNIFDVPLVIAGERNAKFDIQLFADSVNIFDGDNINAKPKFRIEYYDSTANLLGDKDSGLVVITLDDTLIFYNDLNNVPIITRSFPPSNPAMVFEFQPTLKTGNHTLNISAQNSSKTQTIELSRELIVNTDLQLLSVYNYPNPFKDKTRFTFQLSTVPDELSIRIYTVTGRCIRSIKKSSVDLNIGFNKSIEWDGRDEDRSEIANGVYLYKVLLKKNGKTLETISKLAIIK